MSKKSEILEPTIDLESWLHSKPYWEQYVWTINFQKDSLTEEDICLCYKYLSEHLGLIAAVPEKRNPILFTNTGIAETKIVSSDLKIKIVEVKNFEDVNALPHNCSVKFGDNLTLIFGSNGSGKSGVNRLLCNACFSRGDREILPNARENSISNTKSKATFVLLDSKGNVSELNYAVGDNNPILKRFSVFDSKSVLIHLDGSNHVNFTPAQFKIFDKVALTISKLEEKLANEKLTRKKNNPFETMFLDKFVSNTSIFCKSINAKTKPEEFLEHAKFDDKLDSEKMTALQNLIDEKKKLDISKKKSQLAADRTNLEVLKTSLQSILDIFSEAKMIEVNKLIKEIFEKRKTVENLSIQNFNNGILNTIGSPEWKALISAAKTLYETEKTASDNKVPAHCMLCHQVLTKTEETLFQKYWRFLESKAENELSTLLITQTTILEALRIAETTFPKFLETDAGVKVLKESHSAYLCQIQENFQTFKIELEDWTSKLKNFQEVNLDNTPSIDLTYISTLIVAKATEESNLVDPIKEIADLTSQLNSFTHKKAVFSIKDAGLEYIEFLNWTSKASSVNFSAIKATTTKKRTESFLLSVAQNYTDRFSQELKKLGRDFDLVMITSGDQGNTKKEYRLSFAEDYSPSQILSEGEQNACSIADFLTEILIDENNCGIIFDDPVTSLDHEHKDKIASRFVVEAKERQVVIFTHDIVFMSQLVKHAERNNVPVVAHWMKKVNGIPGCIEDNTSPKLTSIKTLKADAQNSVNNFTSLGAKEQERALGAAFDYLRSACEALIEDMLFAGTVKRYDDQIRVKNIEEVIFSQEHALKIVDLHGRLSEVLLAHNRSDLHRENQPQLDDLSEFFKEFNDLEDELKAARKIARDNREIRKKEKERATANW